MKLAFCLFNYFAYGGLQRDFLRIARVCQQRGHEVHVFTMQWEGPEEPGLTLHLLPARGLQNHSRIRSFIDQLSGALAKEPFDSVIGFNKMPHLDLYYAADVCLLARVREKHPWLYRFLPRYRQLLALEKTVFARGAKTNILLISPKQQPVFSECYQTEPERFYLLPPGIAKDRMAPPEAENIRQAVRTQYQLDDEQHLLLMVGSGFKTKGLDRAIQAIAALPSSLRDQCRLFVIGQDNPVPFIKLAKQVKLTKQIHFLGGRDDVSDFFLAADILLHPAYHENTGTVLLEAMIAGLPVLTVDVCGYAHYVSEANAGRVLTSPFKQATFNAVLEEMLVSQEKSTWRANGIAFGKTSDIYSLSEKAVAYIEAQTPKKNFNFSNMMALRGEPFREQKGRLTQRVILNGETYFIKQHLGVGWKEIIKNIFQGRLPILSAENEWRAIQKLQTLGIPVPHVVAYGKRGWNPARIQSFVLLEALTPAISLEELGRDWQKISPLFTFKQNLIQEVARMTRIMHQNGINHRDLYICHFLLRNQDLYLIDLHRAAIRRKIPQRWIIKDLAGLYFSSKDIGLTRRDWLRFIKHYQQQPLRVSLKDDLFWQKVKARGEKLYREHAATV